MSRNGWLIEVRDDAGETTRMPVTTAEVIVGRGEDATLRLDRATVSRRHARLMQAPNGAWRLTDLQSRSGTLLNGERVTEAAVKSGDIIAISRFELRLIHESSTVAAPRERRAPRQHSDDEAESPDISVLTHLAPPRLDMSFIAAVQELGRGLTGITSPPERLQRFCDFMIGDLIQGRWALALRLDTVEPGKVTERLAAALRPTVDEAGLHVSRSTLRAMQESAAPVLATNFRKGDGAVEMSIVSRVPAAAIACPLDEAVGAAIFVSLPPMFGSPEWLALVALAVKQYQQAEASWAAREAARVQAAMERDLVSAREIQRSILPKRNRRPGLEVAWRFTPCETVGGDLVDVIPTPAGGCVLMIADVTGHGLPAALTTLAVHSVAHTCLRSGMSLAQMVTLLNEHLCEYLPPGKFVTMACVAIDPITGEVESLNAGHHAPAIVERGGAVRLLQHARHLPLGLDREEFATDRGVLAGGETLFVSTDGLTELPDASGRQLGAEGLNAAVAELVPTSPELETAADALVRFVDSRRGGGPRLDDQTFLLARRTP